MDGIRQVGSDGKILNYGVRHLLAYTDRKKRKNCVKFRAVGEEDHFYPGCISITFHYTGSEAEAC